MEEVINCKRLRSGQNNPETIDLISGFPDHILQHILSFLPLKDAIKTSVLSRRWESVWASVPTLAFSHRGHNTLQEFANFIDQTLINYKSPKLKKFILLFTFLESYKSRIDSWFRFATRHDVEEIDFRIFIELGTYYVLPQFLCNNSILAKLYLKSCGFLPNTPVAWTSLKSLSLESAKLSDELIATILSGSPVLEHLAFQFCCFHKIRRINITSTRMRELVIRRVRQEEDDILDIWGPHLKSLTLNGNLNGANFRLMDVSSLIEANIDFNMRFECRDVMKDLLVKLHHVENLTLGYWCVQVLSLWVVKGLPSPLFKCKSLTLLIGLITWYLPGILRLLQSSPDLRKLTIDMDYSGFSKDHRYFSDSYNLNGEEWLSPEITFSCLNLNTVEIIGSEASFQGLKSAMGLVKFLLETGRMLEKMTIHAQRKGANISLASIGAKGVQELYEVAQKFIGYRRASPNVVVLFKSHLKSCDNHIG